MRTRLAVSLPRLLSACAVSVALLAPGVAGAAGVSPAEATPEQKKQAMEHFTTGKRAIEGKNWEKAVIELRQSLDAVDSPNARLELARALRESGSLADAWAEYGHVIETATQLATKEPRYAQTADAATSERTDLEPKLAFVTLTVQNAPADAVLKVGGRKVPPAEWTAPVVAPAGAVDVVLSDAGGKELARQTVAAAVGQKTAVTLDAKAAVAAKPASPDPDDNPDSKKPAPDVPSPPPAANSQLRTYAYVAGGVGVAGLAMFAIFGLMDNSTFSDLQSSCPNGACPPSKQDEVSSGRTQQTLANVGLVVGAVGVATGATLFVLSLPKSSSSPAPATGLVVAPGFVGVRGTL